MTEHDTRTGLTFSCCLAALTADGFLFVTLELSLTTGQAVAGVSFINVRDLYGLEVGQLTTQYGTSFDCG